ncbi:hypothetical protein K458DRAFT_149667 [Lentithecium fluviatile CBS 122367]|uniref:Uncharacterized protein n=1 Tax=Lentithecium fluviatile CBS 122367 TaxID=1168545 RepID=A0A6G1JEK4_9PLEO|nr:hypothetical protein K458DRAFT_149667 [Lentithecium fluviatile CBS 122367]
MHTTIRSAVAAGGRRRRVASSSDHNNVLLFWAGQRTAYGAPPQTGADTLSRGWWHKGSRLSAGEAGARARLGCMATCLTAHCVEARCRGHLLGSFSHFTALLVLDGRCWRRRCNAWAGMNASERGVLSSFRACGRVGVNTSPMLRLYEVSVHEAVPPENRRAGRRMCRSCSPRSAMSSRFCSPNPALASSFMIPEAVHRP